MFIRVSVCIMYACERGRCIGGEGEENHATGRQIYKARSHDIFRIGIMGKDQETRYKGRFIRAFGDPGSHYRNFDFQVS